MFSRCCSLSGLPKRRNVCPSFVKRNSKLVCDRMAFVSAMNKDERAVPGGSDLSLDETSKCSSACGGTSTGNARRRNVLCILSSDDRGRWGRHGSLKVPKEKSSPGDGIPRDILPGNANVCKGRFLNSYFVCICFLPICSNPNAKTIESVLFKALCDLGYVSELNSVDQKKVINGANKRQVINIVH